MSFSFFFCCGPSSIPTVLLKLPTITSFSVSSCNSYTLPQSLFKRGWFFSVFCMTTLTLQRTFSLPSNSGDLLTFFDQKVAVTVAPRSVKNFVGLETSEGKWPMILSWSGDLQILMANMSKTFPFSYSYFNTSTSKGLHVSLCTWNRRSVQKHLCHIETSRLIYKENQLNGFYMIRLFTESFSKQTIATSLKNLVTYFMFLFHFIQI